MSYSKNKRFGRIKDAGIAFWIELGTIKICPFYVVWKSDDDKLVLMESVLVLASFG